MLIASTVAAVGCGDSSTSPSGSQEIVVGGLFSLTGGWASLGAASKAAMEVGVEDVNQYLAEGAVGCTSPRRYRTRSSTPLPR